MSDEKTGRRSDLRSCSVCGAKVMIHYGVIPSLRCECGGPLQRVETGDVVDGGDSGRCLSCEKCGSVVQVRCGSIVELACRCGGQLKTNPELFYTAAVDESAPWTLAAAIVKAVYEAQRNEPSALSVKVVVPRESIGDVQTFLTRCYRSHMGRDVDYDYGPDLGDETQVVYQFSKAETGP